MIHILFCGNDGVFDGMLTCALSILKRTSTDEPFTFHVFTMDVSHIKPQFRALNDRQIAFLDSVVKEYHPENRVNAIDVLELYNREFADTPNEQSSYSPYAMLRLLADLVEGMPDKLLYLDVDILLNRDIRLLYDINIEGYEYA